ncbi:purine nucleoside phosphorylase [Buchnera aphidicola str. Bp (Baizongia pistaciae)]|uniref:Purine nucleoside phosphorylase DeoD-type n=1 Tax=Buchnera aphidicola subsp. Baizongia pistaciae (strain Bp) TaxID=224915 RepID=DEOD_BUCBP|nr:purine-nucleoside phosphorylase [Buchnera aphidicola]Q89A58.1 RecName: Full=Purine nucleoside phosphorylase DeoD-type; Short=PNP [Buchnera aphidicola str. Bp (Baizongia pistaciae)]AAO27188.1 purine nucleoside phosphorylase [Buchnera aphidicola str. Bp (Baizongia pistaciae)]
MVTPHINAKKGDFSDCVLMPGDPLRARYIAKNYLKNAIEVTNIRSMLGYTGRYKGHRISVMSHGIGIPSSLIYVKELVSEYNVKKIIRIGTCGTVIEHININDIIICLGASTDSKVNRLRFHDNDFSSVADFYLILDLFNSANNAGIKINIGNFFTTDLFYVKNDKLLDTLQRYNILGIDMETAGIYSLASELGIQVASICTVSDHILKKDQMSYIDRESNLNNMIYISLEALILKKV